MDSLGLFSILIVALCVRAFAVMGAAGLFTVGLIGVISTRQRPYQSVQKSKRWVSLALLFIGGIGLIYMVGGLAANLYSAQHTTSCLELSVTDDYKITFSSSYSEARLKQVTGQLIDELPAIYSYILADHYLVGRTSDPQGGYFWFDLDTRMIKRFAYSQRSEFVRSVQEIGFPEMPLYLTIEEHCKTGVCQPCISDANK